MDVPKIIGHRGAKGEAPENTLASIRQAHASGARWVEFDVKLTADAVPILMHDERLNRTTNGCGPVRETSLAAIRALDAGGWFEARFAGEPVPTLEEALGLCLDLGLAVNIEIKPCQGREVETAQVALARARSCWPADGPEVLVSSFAEASLLAARDAAPDWPRGYLSGPIPVDWQRRLATFACTTLNVDGRRFSAARAAAVRAAGVPLLVYTVNDPLRARALLAAGATSIITDEVALLTRILSDP